jgi:hypothetical protein
MVLLGHKFQAFDLNALGPKETSYDREFKNLRNKNICPFS